MADADDMHVKSKIFVGVCLLGVAIAGSAFIGGRGATKDVAVDNEVVEVAATSAQAAENLPEYLAFESVLESGVSLTVEDSAETEYEADDEDHELEVEEISFSDDSEETTSRRKSDEEVDEDELSEEQLLELKEQQEQAEIKGSVEPGIYVSPLRSTGCSYELWRVMDDNKERLIGQDQVGQGRLIVNINGIEPDRFYSSSECKEWSPWTPLEEPLEVAGDGDYWFGDLKEGTWTVPDGCVWERVVDFRGALLSDVAQSGVGPGELAVGEEPLGIRLRGCSQEITHTSNAIDEALQYEESERSSVDLEVSGRSSRSSKRSRSSRR